MSSINPNDPVIGVLKGLVQDYEKKYENMQQHMEAMTESLQYMGQGFSKAIAAMQIRLATIEAALSLAQQDTRIEIQELGVSPEESGKEL